MREREMQELMQQDIEVPKKVHDGFEKGIQQIVHVNREQEETIDRGGEVMSAGHRGRRLFWHRTGLVAAAAAVAIVIAFHSQIYSFAKSLFVHDTIKVGDTDVQKTDMRIIKIKDGVLTDDFERYYFESMKDLGEKLGVSFLKSSAENEVTGKGRVVAWMHEWGEVSVSDSLFAVKDVSEIRYTEDGTTYAHMDSDNAYSISSKAVFYTKQFQDDYGIKYEDADVIEDYKTQNGFHATIFHCTDENSDEESDKERDEDLSAVISHDNIRYEFSVDGACTLEEFKAFLDTLTE